MKGKNKVIHILNNFIIQENMNKYLIALDMDGTLLNSSQKIGKLTSSYLHSLALSGHIIVIASGRPFRSIEPYYNELGLSSPCICYNGGYIYSSEKNFEEDSFFIPKEVCIDVISTLDRSRLLNVMCENSSSMHLLHQDDILSKYFFMDKINIVYGELKDTLQDDPNIIIFRATDEKEDFKQEITKAVEKHGLKIRFWSGLTSFSEIYSPKVTKAHALNKIAQYYQIPKENIIAFGDAPNDLEMLEEAGVGVAMKNASSELLKVAKYITPTDNNHDGIYYFLQDFFANKNI
ncbi:MAG: Cof-type HAD-IIB family hydrolase [Bacilli bacterium]